MQPTTVLFLLALVTPMPGAAAPAERGPRGVCAVEVTDLLVEAPEKDRVPSFSAIRVRDLLFRTRLRAGSPTVSLRVYTPGGHLYQTVAASPSVERESRGGPVATVRLAVTGTAITTNGLYGRWKVEPWLAGAVSACGPAREFVLTE
jgi:hypothetical protein